MDDATLAALKQHKGPPITLRPSRVKWSLLLVAFVAGVAVGMLLISDGNRIGWLIAIFFGLGVVAAVTQLIGRGNYVRFEPSGFTIGSSLRSTKIRWTDVEQFTVVAMHHARFVGYRLTGDATSRLARVNRATYGIDGMLADTYGISAAELTEILERRRTAVSEQEWRSSTLQHSPR